MVLGAFFDLEKAYDTARTNYILEFHVLGLRGQLPFFIQHLLSSQTIQLRTSTLLRPFYVEEGVPQGSVMSVVVGFNVVSVVLPNV